MRLTDDELRYLEALYDGREQGHELERAVMKFDDALSLAKRGIQIAGSFGFRPLRTELLHLAGAARGFAVDAQDVDSLDEALAAARAIAIPRLEWEVLQTIMSLHERHGESEQAMAAASRADQISLPVLAGLPRILRGITWHSRIAVVDHGARKRKLSACAG